jgi:hypothetical protein
VKRTPIKRKTELRRTDGFARSNGERSAQTKARRRKSISPASPQQRAYVREVGFCMACGGQETDDNRGYFKLTFAHWWPRGRGGCDSKLCGSVLCCRPGGTGCHDRQERGEIDLLALVVEDWDDCRERFQHALEHARPVELLEKLAGARIEWSRHTTRRETG